MLREFKAGKGAAPCMDYSIRMVCRMNICVTHTLSSL